MEYSMKINVFCNTSSPAILPPENSQSWGTRIQMQNGFVDNDFHVDNGLQSTPEPSKATDLLNCTPAMLATANLRLHKIASNHPAVTQAFPAKIELLTKTCDLDLSKDTISVKRCLGVLWDILTDSFTFRVSLEEKPFTGRGVLSVIQQSL